MKVGDYVRTKYEGGSIEKIIKIYHKEENIDLIERYATDISIKYNLTINEEEIIKSSPNIIDLIEVGDYVNGHLVFDIAYAPKKAVYIEDNTNKMAHIPYVNEDIESIVTKEQFSQMEYRIGE